MMKSIRKNLGIFTIFTSFFTNFFAVLTILGEFPRKLMSCWLTYFFLVLSSIFCRWRPYCAVGVLIVLLASLLMLVLLLASLYYFWHPCCYGSPFCCWRCDVPIVSAAVSFPPCCCWLHYFCKHPCFWWCLYCVGGPVVRDHFLV